MSKNTFRTHTGEIVSGERLRVTLDAVATSYEVLARNIRTDDAYASHVSEKTKDEILERDLAHAQRIRSGVIDSYTTAQSVNTELTNECIPLLPKEKDLGS